MDQVEIYISRIQKVLIFIENNLDEEFSLNQLSHLACYSPFHFHRIFHAIVGETVHQYIKRLRIERSAGKLRYTDEQITQIALDASYDTASSFTKAFTQHMGTSPKGYRSLHADMSVTRKKIQELAMIHPDKIEKKAPDLNLLFIRRCGDYTKSPQEAWQALQGFMKTSQLDPTQIRYFGICHDDPGVTDKENLRYDAAIYYPQALKGQGEVGEQRLKGGKYAVFTHHGTYEGLEKQFDQIFLKWLPKSQELFDETRSVFCEYFNRLLA